MKWSLRVGRFAGIDVYVHVTFLMILGFLGLANWFATRNLASVVDGLLFFLALFLCVVLHEYGHALTARRYGIKTKDITLLPIGGVARLESLPKEPIKELWIAVAGPAVNVVIAGLLAVWLTVGQHWHSVGQLSPTQGHFAERLLAANLILIIFNLLPAFPMDGGRVLRAFLALRMDYARATNIAAVLGQGIALIFGFIGLFINPLLILIALFVWIGAGQEASMAQMRSSLAGVSVERAMMTDFRSLGPNDSLARAVDLVLSGSQADFPVVDDGRLVGVLTRADLVAALAKGSPATAVSQVMKRDLPVLSPDDSLEDSIARGKALEVPVIPVVANGRLVGLLTMENVSEYVLIQNALREFRSVS
ncbi:MAG: site-2 protease family protein [Verrucomicrobia bacterium]|nr:site-2 protease family protein [Verrucomicrobiota bacterium]